MYNKKVCKNIENVENYEKALAENFKKWVLHHRLETHLPNGERREVDISMDELILLNMYYNRPAEELIFLRKGEHSILHNKGKPRPKTEEHKKNISESLKGKPSPNKGKHLSAEQRKKLSEINKGKYVGDKNPFYGKKHTEEAKKKMSEKAKGRCPMLGKQHSKESKKKMSEAATERNIGKHWFNNGKENKFCYECPNGFVTGRLRKS